MSCCIECHTDNVIDDTVNGCSVCTNCGLCSSTILISEEKEWRDEQKSRVGGPEILNIGLSTSMTGKLGHLQYSTTLSKGNKKLLTCLKRIPYYCERLNVPEFIKLKTCEIFEQYTNIHRLHKKDLIVLACIYLACYNDIPRTFQEMSHLTCLYTSEQIQRCTMKIQKTLNITMNNILPHQFIPRYCSLLKCSKIEPFAYKMSFEIKSTHYSTQTIAAAIIMITCQQNNIELSYQRLSYVTSSSINLIRLAMNDLIS